MEKKERATAQSGERIIKDPIVRIDSWTRIFKAEGYSWKEAQRKAEKMVEETQ